MTITWTPLVAAAPTATTGAASNVTGSTVSLAGSVNPNSAQTAVVFEFGPTLSFGSITSTAIAGSGSSDVQITGSLSGLTSGTTYYYRLVATNSVGTTFGAVSSFTTTGAPSAPDAVTLPVTSTGDTSAELAGTVNPRRELTAYTFEYGTTTTFGSITPVVGLDAANVPEAVSASLTGLASNATYFYRLVATNATGTTTGAVLSFTTGPASAPVVTTGTASGVTAGGATLAATVDPRGSQTTFAFEYGTSVSFGSLSAIDNAGSTAGVQNVSLPLAGLAPNTTYLYRVVATNAIGTSTGVVQSFTTTSSALRARAGL